jgi:hypothetical protein
MLKFKAFALFVNAYQWFPIWLHTMLARQKAFKYEVSVCLIFKNEARYLREWIEYHLLIGVDHFYLYNNFSDDNYSEILAPYIQQGLVTLTEYPHQYAQVQAYEDCYRRFHDESHWIGYIDADEFVNIVAYNDIKQLLNKYSNMPGLFLNWKMFGTSGYLKEDGSLVVERYTASWPWLCHVGKTFINNNYNFRKIAVHFHRAKYLGFPLYPVNLDYVAVPYCESLVSLSLEKKAYLNHYWSKSYEQYVYKDYVKGDVEKKENEAIKHRSDRFAAHELYNRSRDYSIQRWLVLLKNRMN